MKDYREKELKYLLLLFIFLFLIWCTPTLETLVDEERNSYEIVVSGLECVLISGAVSLASFLLDCVVSSSVKDKLVGLFFIPRSGETIFSRINKNLVSDNCFLVEVAKEYYAPIIEDLPHDKKKRRQHENAKWYSIYQVYQEKGQVKQSQRDYLLCRDIFYNTIEFLMLYIISLFLFKGTIHYSSKFILVLLTIAIISNTSTHTKMNRFVNTVIAVDIANKNHIESR